ncbi:FCD domain-containing protein [Sphingomonas aerophila]|jgi:GntR family transcriptional repressor for pyruvate dehydrogenase complex|uniref:Pyruvate dehydrogenase complex repressor n=1 Tax=Sphingomonas aerophila TaxID=1344948 RepID=A0A7W9BG29_9SPHN|nr:FCD domain-containing protein [Sphingomonas aerophila]MBB5716368.1 GntR family transcriptional repressor for pyruvate dehydrogenase complex [Sphingomonas aerophila]
MTLPPIKPAKLADAIAEHIQQLILEGAIQPGERLLSERELSMKLEVSRPSLREALDKLIGRGLIATDAQGTSYVSETIGQSLRDPLIMLMDNPDARGDCMEFRSVVEAAAAGFAAERASEIDRDSIRACFAAMVSAHQQSDVDEIARTDAEFHFAIYNASHNLMMIHLMRSLETIIRSNVYLNRKNLYEHRVARESQLAEHRAIFDAIMARDVLAAQDAARHHMLSAMQTQRAIQESEKRLEASIRRLVRNDLVAPPKKRSRSA